MNETEKLKSPLSRGQRAAVTRNFTQGVGREELEPWPSESPGAGRERGLVARRAEEEQERRITLGCQRVRKRVIGRKKRNHTPNLDWNPGS